MLQYQDFADMKAITKLKPKSISRRFSNCAQGNVGVAFAFALVPLLAAAGAAVDYESAFGQQTKLQAFVDSTALAAASGATESVSEKKGIANAFINSEFSTITPRVVVNGDQVKVSVSQDYETAFMKIVGIDTVSINVTATAIAKSTPVCILALDPSATDALKIWGSSSQVVAKDCVVHSNSKAASGMSSTSNAISTAAVFCSSGGASAGQFDPPPKTFCNSVKDPYVGLPVPSVGSCDQTNLSISSGRYSLRPGVYCGGLKITGGDVNLTPGTYIMKDGDFSVGGSTANIRGVNVTIYLYGDTSAVSVVGGAVVELSAPRYGPYDGMVFVQNPSFGKTLTSKFSGNSDTKIVGAGYFPTQTLDVGGTADFDINSPYMAFVAQNLEFHGNGSLTMNLDPAGSGYKLNIPRQYDGARLIK